MATETADPGGITVDGIGSVEARPDTGIVDIGVATQAPSVGRAREAAAEAAASVIAALKASGVEERDIQTVHFAIAPVHDYSGPQPRLTGYSVSNTVMAKVRGIDRLGPVIDAAAEAGGDATRVNSIRFEVEDRAELVRQARERAMADARAKAGQLAGLAGVELGVPMSIAEFAGGRGPAPVAFESMALRAAKADTPIEAGATTVEVRLVIRWAIAGR